MTTRRHILGCMILFLAGTLLTALSFDPLSPRQIDIRVRKDLLRVEGLEEPFVLVRSQSANNDIHVRFTPPAEIPPRIEMTGETGVSSTDLTDEHDHNSSFSGREPSDVDEWHLVVAVSADQIVTIDFSHAGENEPTAHLRLDSVADVITGRGSTRLGMLAPVHGRLFHTNPTTGLILTLGREARRSLPILLIAFGMSVLLCSHRGGYWFHWLRIRISAILSPIILVAIATLPFVSLRQGSQFLPLAVSWWSLSRLESAEGHNRTWLYALGLGTTCFVLAIISPITGTWLLVCLLCSAGATVPPEESSWKSAPLGIALLTAVILTGIVGLFQPQILHDWYATHRACGFTTTSIASVPWGHEGFDPTRASLNVLQTLEQSHLMIGWPLSLWPFAFTLFLSPHGFDLILPVALMICTVAVALSWFADGTLLGFLATLAGVRGLLFFCETLIDHEGSADDRP